MQFRSYKMRFRRRFRSQKRNVERLSLEAEEQLEERFFKRLIRLKKVRRFIFLWMALFVVLIAGVLVQTQALSNYFQTLRYVPGGIYNEGVVGNFTNANPVYAATTADTTVSHLIFAGLFKYDKNGQLANDLAESYKTNAQGNVYTVTLKPNLKWHDGYVLTAKDVAFTFHLIQNPDARSPLNGSWQNIQIEALNDQTVQFTLPGALSSFPYSLTTGIVPEHILKTVAVGDLRSTSFNAAKPVGAGPFMFQTLEVSGDTPSTRQEQIALTPFAQYNGGEPKLDQFIVRVFQDQTNMIDSYKQGNLTAIAGLSEVPQDIANDSSNTVNSITTSAADMVFFKTTSGILSDKAVRQALVAAANPNEIIAKLGYKTAAVTEPLLAGQIGYDGAYGQKTNQPAQAAALLDGAGWVIGSDGLRHKDEKTLRFTLSAQDTPENRMVTKELQQQWRGLGIDLKTSLESPTDLQDTVTFHTYDALLYGITIGSDPDVFAYWDSSQADVRSANRLNFSEYSSPTADSALEAGRTRVDPALRGVKYRPFLEAWQADAPALGLYQPRFIYITKQPIDGFTANKLVNPTDRFNNVQNWMVRQAKVTN